MREMKFGKAVVKLRHAILVIALVLLIPSAIGMAKTHVYLDMFFLLMYDM